MTSFVQNCNLLTTANEHNFFHFHFKNIIIEILSNCPTIIIGDFNIHISMLTKTIQQ